MQRGVIATVHDVNTGAPHDEHVNNAAPALPARPVEGAESMVVTEITSQPTNQTSFRWNNSWDAFVDRMAMAYLLSRCGGC